MCPQGNPFPYRSLDDGLGMEMRSFTGVGSRFVRESELLQTGQVQRTMNIISGLVAGKAVCLLGDYQCQQARAIRGQHCGGQSDPGTRGNRATRSPYRAEATLPLQVASERWRFRGQTGARCGLSP